MPKWRPLVGNPNRSNISFSVRAVVMSRQMAFGVFRHIFEYYLMGQATINNCYPRSLIGFSTQGETEMSRSHFAYPPRLRILLVAVTIGAAIYSPCADAQDAGAQSA